MTNNEVSVNNEEEISFLDMTAVLYRYKWMIIGITGIVAVIMVAFTLLCIKLPADKSPKPPVFQTQVQLTINENALSNSRKYNVIANQMVKSNAMRTALKDSLTQKGIKDVNNKLKNNIATSWDNGTGIFTVTFSDNYADTPKIVLDEVSAYLIDYINNTMVESKEKELAKYKNQLDEADKLLKQYKKEFDAAIAAKDDVRIVQQNYNTQLTKYNTVKTNYDNKVEEIKAYKNPIEVFEGASAKAKKIGPDRKKPVIMAVFGAFVLSILLAFILNAVDGIRKDKEAMAKFHQPTIFNRK